MNALRRCLQEYFDPAERLTEVLFGLLMVLTCTLGAGLTVQEGREATREMLLAALGCNVAWGLINGVIRLMDRMYERGHGARLILAARQARSEEEALEIAAEALDPTLEPITSFEERERLYRDVLAKVRDMPLPRMTLCAEDLAGAAVTFVVMFLTACTAIVPFLFISDLLFALRVSNSILLGLLFIVGYCWARETNVNAWLGGLAMLLIGVSLVAIAKLLGG